MKLAVSAVRGMAGGREVESEEMGEMRWESEEEERDRTDRASIACE